MDVCKKVLGALRCGALSLCLDYEWSVVVQIEISVLSKSQKEIQPVRQAGKMKMR